MIFKAPKQMLFPKQNAPSGLKKKFEKKKLINKMEICFH